MDHGIWQETLERLTRECGVPGAQLAVLESDRVSEFTTGVLNVETGVEVTSDSVFQIGSVAKTFTTTLVMQLVDDGLVGLDQPILEQLPELRLADMASAGKVTVRHLLSHTSGIEGEHFEDTGRGDDVLERYVESCAGIGFCHPVGATMSYCNTGLVLAGRIVEKLRGGTWDDVLRERLVKPLGLSRTVTLAEEAIRFRAAYGHTDDPTPALVPTWQLPRSLGPAGLICASATDVVAFARMHLDRGRAPDGTSVLSPESVAQMQVPQVELPDPWTLAQHWGLGWEVFDWSGRTVLGHDGNTIGQAACLRVVPDRRVAVALLTNGGHSGDLYHALFPRLLAELCDLEMPAPLAPPDPPPIVDAAPYAGVYAREGIRIELDAGDGVLAGRIVSLGSVAEAVTDDDPVEEFEAVPVAENVFATRDDGEVTWTPMVFFELGDGVRYLHMAGRATPRVSASAAS